MPEHDDETDAPEHEHEHDFAAVPPSFQMRCKVCGHRPTKAERWRVEDKKVDEAETK